MSSNEVNQKVTASALRTTEALDRLQVVIDTLHGKIDTLHESIAPVLVDGYCDRQATVASIPEPRQMSETTACINKRCDHLDELVEQLDDLQRRIAL